MKEKADLGISLLNKKRFPEAKKVFSELIFEFSDHFYPRYLLGLLQIKTDDYRNALENLLVALNLNYNHIPTYVDISFVYTKLKEYKKAEDILTKGLSLENKNQQLKINLSYIYLVQGKMEELIKNDREILKINPNNYYILNRLDELKQPVLNKKLKSNLKREIKKKNITFENKVYMNFLLARYENNIGKISTEYEFLMKAHETIFLGNKKSFQDNNNLIFSKLRNIHQNYEKDIALKHLDLDTHELKPIFIFGLPRSGSTILEKIILNSNTKVVAGEETRFFNEIVETLYFDKYNGNIVECFSNIKQKYLELTNTNKLNTIFTDKSLNNFFFLGWIKLIFPKAKFINCNRDPSIIASSIIRNNLSNLSWAHRLEDIKKYFDVYYDVLEKWSEKIDIDVYQFHYDNLIKDFDSETRKILSFCDLKWNTDLINFNKSKFVSQTASNIKVREIFSREEDQKHIGMSNFIKKKFYKFN
tara:strand:- start:112 stop:1536 length:1425 start_codon:yes stop_codon:yes gene_type:complete